MAKSIIGKENYIEIYINAPIAISESRDQKGLNKPAITGRIKNFMGLDSIYEKAENSNLI